MDFVPAAGRRRSAATFPRGAAASHQSVITNRENGRTGELGVCSDSRTANVSSDDESLISQIPGELLFPIMKSSSPPPSSSSVTAASESRLPSSSLSPPLPRPPRLSLGSPELQAEFLRECQNRVLSHSDVTSSSSSSPSSSNPSSTSSSPRDNRRQARLSLSSPELLSELKESRTRPLRHVPAHNGLTTVFCGRGRQGSGSAPSTPSANQKTSH